MSRPFSGRLAASIVLRRPRNSQEFAANCGQLQLSLAEIGVRHQNKGQIRERFAEKLIAESRLLNAADLSKAGTFRQVRGDFIFFR